MYVVVRHIVKMLVIVLCALLWEATSSDHALSTCIEFQSRERQPRPPTALQWGREELSRTVHAADPGVSLSIHNN